MSDGDEDDEATDSAERTFPEVVPAAMLGSLGQVIRRRRCARGISQAALARGVRLTEVDVALIERGRCPLTTRLVARIADRIGVSLEFLLSVEDPPPIVADVPSFFHDIIDTKHKRRRVISI